MDPQANIEEQRTLAERMLRAADRMTSPRGVDFERDAVRLAELAQALDEWRRRGGYDPYGVGGYDPNMRLEYRDLQDLEADAQSVEVTIEITDPQTGDKRAQTWDNLTNPMYFLVANGLRPASEQLTERPEFLLKNGERELADTEGTALDGATGQAIIDSWRAHQGDKQLLIEVDGDPSLFDQETH